MEKQLNFNKEALRLVHQRMSEKGWSQSELGRRLNIKPSSVYRMLHANTIRVEKLRRLSLVLEYNFFTALAGQLDLPEPSESSIRPADYAECQERIRELEIENRTLLKILKSED